MMTAITRTDDLAAAATMRVLAAIADKRAGRRMDAATISAIVADFVDGRVPDYQMAAWLATVACRNLDAEETAALTDAYVDSGTRIRLRDDGRPIVDKHSTGGVGDKVTLYVAPIVAACGVAVGKVSGRGLGFAGGTVDKLQSIRGLRMDLSADEMRTTLKLVGMTITGQSDDLVPGDRATYGLRDVTGTVDNIPLIAASVMSKKIAAGTNGVVLDVKYGEGALIPERDRSEELARAMVDIGERSGLACRAVVSDMNRPLGYAVGNALEVKEALAALRGTPVAGLDELGGLIARLMLQIARPELDDTAADGLVREAIDSGAAWRQFRRWVAAQGGDVRQIDDPDLLPSAAHRLEVLAEEPGWVTAIAARPIGEAATLAGAGRLRYDQPIDPGAGVMLCRQLGERVENGQPLAELHWSGEKDVEPLTSAVRAAFTLAAEPAGPGPVVHKVICR
jgi:pyrimidine-nucleoside phosphorylase